MLPIECIDLGEFAAVVWNVPQFVRRMRLAARRRRYGIAWRKVEYYDPLTFHGQFGELDSVFWKQLRFAFQREFRFAINSNSVGDQPLILNIGSLKNIISLHRTSELVNREQIRALVRQQSFETPTPLYNGALNLA